MSRYAIRVIIVVLSFTMLLCLTVLALSMPTHLSAIAQPIEHITVPTRIATTSAFTLGIELIANGVTLPTYVASPADGSGRLFVLEQAGRIRVISNSVLLNLPYLDITNIVSPGVVVTDSELGLLGMAFDPDFVSNGTFYVDYINLDGNTNVERFTVANPANDVAAIITATKILTVVQPYAQHKGGNLQFGPNDGYLYFGLGDGGGAGDPQGNGQNLDTLLGKILRIDVRNVPTYTIPPTNPFTRTVGVQPEIWAYGLRNPWRFSFDRLNGDLYIGDVGQHCYEEVDYQPFTSHGGENFGWNLMEGYHGFDPLNYDACAQPILTPPPPTLTLPVFEYPHSGLLAAIVSGYVYRGTRYPQAAGVYFYADHEQGLIWSLEQNSPGNWLSTLRLDISPRDISSFGEDSNGELYLATYSDGEVYHVVMGPPPPSLATSTKTAGTSSPHRGEVLTYTIVLRNTGSPFTNTVHVTDTVPPEIVYVPGSFTATLGTVDPLGVPTLRWAGIMSDTPIVTLTYAATASTITTVTNDAVIDPEFTTVFTRSATIVVSRFYSYLPLLLKSP
jgi:uncharacterized repeat protein (TIGR01451 family)